MGKDPVGSSPLSPLAASWYLLLGLLSPSIQFSFPSYFYSAMPRPKTVSLLTNCIHSIQREIPTSKLKALHTPTVKSQRRTPSYKTPTYM